MLIRYSRGPDGKPVKKAVVYTSKEHSIDRKSLDPEAVHIVERLASHGHDAYIVGGAVRDLLVGRKPKDFDIVTDAQPPRIRHIFRSSRIIGRRFRLVHVYSGSKIYEVCTFRSLSQGTVGNVYGTIDEDSKRRDFTFNALYYDPIRDQIVDYVGGIKDIRARVIKPVIPLKTIFDEDPVRMLRAAKYAAMTNFRLPWGLKRAIKAKSALLAGVSHSRLSEELIKILGSGSALAIVDALESLGLFRHFMPNAARVFEDAARHDSFRNGLRELDDYVAGGGERALSALLSRLVKDEVNSAVDEFKARIPPTRDPHEAFRSALNAARSFLEPLCLPRADLEAAVGGVFSFEDLVPSPGRKRRGSRRRSGRPREDQPPAPGPA
ncbi:MAG: polynucleotide adenylyltransferase PcnB [Spirochaetes bacterium]|nr:polynucleotide adenylyltransferase PcnB [Spirochaetota bacterium]